MNGVILEEEKQKDCKLLNDDLEDTEAMTEPSTQLSFHPKAAADEDEDDEE